MPADVKLLQEFFCEGMLAGYASNAKPQPLSGLPGSKHHWHDRGELTLIDVWITSSGSRDSSGWTIILVNDKPIWRMQYDGYYHKDVIPFLREALKTNYESGKFFAGRGPRDYCPPGRMYRYMNHTDRFDFEFDRFKGSETIVLANGPVGTTRSMGRHAFSGGLFRLETI